MRSFRLPCFTTKLIYTSQFSSILTTEHHMLEARVRIRDMNWRTETNVRTGSIQPFTIRINYAIIRGYFFNTRLPVACILITFWRVFLPLGHDPSVFGTEHYYPLIVRPFAAHYSQRQKRPTRIRGGTPARTRTHARLHSSTPPSACTHAPSPNL